MCDASVSMMHAERGVVGLCVCVACKLVANRGTTRIESQCAT